MRRKLSSFELPRLRRHIKPFRLHWFARLRSTNDHAAALRKRGKLFAPAIVLTGRQMAGRGRGTNSWWSGQGSLTVTFVFPVEEHLSPHQVPLLAGLAVRDAAAKLAGDEMVALRWPNDVVHRGRKLAGVLCERVMKADLVGVGVNVNIDPRQVPAGLRAQVASLAGIAGEAIDLTDALIEIARRLHAALSRRGERLFVETLKRYDAHHALVGRRVKVLEAGSGKLLVGRCDGIDSAGRLILRDRKRLHRIIAGEVRVH